jgi:hypothetical protein
VTSRFINSVSIASDTEIELVLMLDKRLIQRGKKDISLPFESIDGKDEKSVILTGIAANDGSIAITSRPVSGKNLSLKRIFQIDQLRLVKF